MPNNVKLNRILIIGKHSRGFLNSALSKSPIHQEQRIAGQAAAEEHSIPGYIISDNPERIRALIEERALRYLLRLEISSYQSRKY